MLETYVIKAMVAESRIRAESIRNLSILEIGSFLARGRQKRASTNVPARGRRQVRMYLHDGVKVHSCLRKTGQVRMYLVRKS